MTHVFSLALLAGERPAAAGPDTAAQRTLAEHGVAALLDGPLADAEHGGWRAAASGDDAKLGYGHAFVVLAGSSATAAGIDGGEDLLDRALDVLGRHFWDADHGMVVDRWDPAWSTLDPYRGVNANMHAVEALLAAGDVTGDPVWHERAAAISARVVGWAGANGWRVPEHFDEQWQPLLEHNRDRPADPFQPYGATVGHGLEWARLLVAVDLTLGAAAPGGLVDAAVALADRAVADGWAADGSTGFVYTTDWEGRPVVRSRMHWVAAEAVAAADVLRRVTRDERWTGAGAQWWRWIDEHLVDHDHGSWRHELDEDNRPAAEVWPGKPDVYHAYQAALLPELPVVPSFAAALAAAGGIEEM